MPPISLHPDDASEGSVFPEGLYRWDNPRWERFNYGGAIQNHVLAFAVTLTSQDPASLGNQYDQHWANGDLNAFQPSADGKRLEQVGSRSTLNKNSNFMTLMTSLLNGGYPANLLRDRGDDVSQFEGLIAFMTWQDPPKRENMAQTAAQTARGPRQISVVQRVESLPGQTPNQTPAPTRTGAARASTPRQASTAPAQAPVTAAGAAPVPANGHVPAEVEEEAQSLLVPTILDYLGKNGGRGAKHLLMTDVFKSGVGSAPQVRQRLVQLLNDAAAVAATGVATIEGPDLVMAG